MIILNTQKKRYSANARAFSLVEILVVLAIISVIGGMMSGLFKNNKDRDLARTGNMVSDMASNARQTAMSKNRVTALVITPKISPTDEQGMMLMEFDADAGAWKFSTKWMRIPINVQVVDNSHSQEFVNRIAPLQLKMENLIVEDYSALLFYPDGRIENGEEPLRRLSVRSAADSAEVPSETLRNYYDLLFNLSNSSFHVVRP